MFFKRRRRPAEPADIPFPAPMDPALYGRLVNGALPTGWLDFHHEFLSSHDSLLQELDSESRLAPDDPSAGALHAQYLAAFEQYRAECDARGECFVKYFADTHGGQDDLHRHWLTAHGASQ